MRCLSEDVIPVSIRLKSNIKTPKGFQIIKRAEKALLNERIRSINNTINMLGLQRDTRKNDLEERIGEEAMEECSVFIKSGKKARHFKTMYRQKSKIERLCHRNSIGRGVHTNITQGDHTAKASFSSESTDTTVQPNKWVINISDKPLTKAQEKLLTHGPNFAVVPKNPPIMEYVATVEQACSKLGVGKAEESRVKVKAAIRKMHIPQPNITKKTGEP